MDCMPCPLYSDTFGGGVSVYIHKLIGGLNAFGSSAMHFLPATSTEAVCQFARHMPPSPRARGLTPCRLWAWAAPSRRWGFAISLRSARLRVKICKSRQRSGWKHGGWISGSDAELCGKVFFCFSSKQHFMSTLTEKVCFLGGKTVFSTSGAQRA